MYDVFAQVMATSHGSFGVIILTILTVTAIFAPIIAPYDPIALTDDSLAPPSWTYLFGTDNLGHDIFSMVVYGARSSLIVGLSTALASLLLGGVMGMLAGYYRGVFETVLMRVAELFQTLPAIIIVLFLVSLFGSSFWLLLAAVALAIWPLQARLVYGQFIRLREADYVAAAIVAGLPVRHVILREMLPNAMQPIIVQVALDASIAILIEAALGYLGISDPNMVSWGQLLYEAQNFMSEAWWMSIFPGAAICLAIVGLNMVADGLNEAADPKSGSASRNFHD
ncbi:MAG: ABC transporter permease [Paracoccaceae bacterium]